MLSKISKAIAKAPIHFYRAVISPWFPPTCRYTPTCSTYALEAIDRHGAIKGTYLTIRRLMRCTPWSHHPHHDPVPEVAKPLKSDSK